MRKFLLVCLIFLVGCSNNSQSETVFNTGSGSYMFKDESRIIYFNFQNNAWLYYDIEKDAVLPVSSNVTRALKEPYMEIQSRTKVIPYKEGVYLFEEHVNLNDVNWTIESIPYNTSVGRRIADSSGNSLIDARTMGFLLKGGTSDFKMNIFSKEHETLESNNSLNVIPFNNYVYHITDFDMYRTDFFGKNRESLSIRLNLSRTEVSFSGDFIYYLDPVYSVRRYNTKTKVDTLVVEDVYMFEIDERGIYYTSLTDSSYNYYDFEDKSNRVLTHEYGRNMKTDFEHVYYLGGPSGFDLLRTSIETGVVESIARESLSFYLLDDSIFILDTNYKTSIIKK